LKSSFKYEISLSEQHINTSIDKQEKAVECELNGKKTLKDWDIYEKEAEKKKRIWARRQRQKENG